MSFSSTASSFLSLSIALPSLRDSFSRLATLCSTLRNLASDIAGKDISFAAQCHDNRRLEQCRWIVSRRFLKLRGIFHGFEDQVVESFELFIGIADHKLLLEVFEEVLFGLITSKNQVGVVMRLFKEAFKRE
jgi:hypothetical protein